jgi:putative transposase
MKISLGKGIDNKQICIYGILSRSIRKHDKIYSFRICKEYGKYYGIFVIEVGKKEKKMELKDARKRFVVIDPNHVNVFMCYDYNNESFVLERNNFVKNIDNKIYEISNKLSKERKYVDDIKEQKYLIEKQLDDELDLNYLDGFSSEDELIKLNISIECIKNKKDLKKIFRKKGEYTYSYNRYLKWLYKLYIKRRDQIKTFAYTVAHMLYSKYDYVSYGDYVPSKDTAPYQSMYRKMVQEDIVGYLREIISKSAKKYGKFFNKVSEINTTKDCSYCGDSVKKDPSVRYYTCPNCGKSYVRDLNSCINIALKDKLLSRVDLLTIDISSVDCKMIYSLSRGCVMIN